MHAKALARSERPEFGLDLFAAHFGPKQHAILFELFFVFGRAFDSNRLLAEKSVSFRATSRVHLRKRNGSYPPSEQSHNPADWANEPRSLNPGPIHGARPGNSA